MKDSGNLYKTSICDLL